MEACPGSCLFSQSSSCTYSHLHKQNERRINKQQTRADDSLKHGYSLPGPIHSNDQISSLAQCPKHIWFEQNTIPQRATTSKYRLLIPDLYILFGTEALIFQEVAECQYADDTEDIKLFFQPRPS